MSVNIVHASQIEAAFVQASQSGGFGSILSILSTIVQQYDDQISFYTAELTAINQEKNSLNEQKNVLSSMQTESDAVTRDIVDESDDVIGSESGYKLDSDEFDDLSTLADEYGVDISDYSEGFVPQDVFDDIQNQIDTRLTDLNNTSEIKMINFQSLMDSRKQSMMMLSNLLSSENTTRQSIIQNLKS